MQNPRVIFHHYQKYRHRWTIQTQNNSNIQNTHFHAFNCVLMRWNNFVPANVIITREFLLYLNNEHKEVIKKQAGYFDLARIYKFDETGINYIWWHLITLPNMFNATFCYWPLIVFDMHKCMQFLLFFTEWYLEPF